MRLRDIITASLDMLVDAALLPPYPPRPRALAPATRSGSVWSREQAKAAAYGAADHPFLHDPAAMARGCRFIHLFRAGAAGRSPEPGWPLPDCLGPFPRLAPADALHHLAAALESAGLRPMGGNAILHEGWFETGERAAVKDLPLFYGRAMAQRTGGEPWDEPVELVLRVQCRITPATTATLALSAPALSLMALLQRRLAAVLRGPGPSPAQALMQLVAADWRRLPPGR